MDVISIETVHTGEIDYDDLEKHLLENRDRPVIINANIGTTVKGAVDDVHRILKILKSLKIPSNEFYVHCDGALFALMLPFVDNSPEVCVHVCFTATRICSRKDQDGVEMFLSVGISEVSLGTRW